MGHILLRVLVHVVLWHRVFGSIQRTFPTLVQVVFQYCQFKMQTLGVSVLLLHRAHQSPIAQNRRAQHSTAQHRTAQNRTEQNRTARSPFYEPQYHMSYHPIIITTTPKNHQHHYKQPPQTHQHQHQHQCHSSPSQTLSHRTPPPLLHPPSLSIILTLSQPHLHLTLPPSIHRLPRSVHDPCNVRMEPPGMLLSSPISSPFRTDGYIQDPATQTGASLSGGCAGREVNWVVRILKIVAGGRV